MDSVYWVLILVASVVLVGVLAWCWMRRGYFISRDSDLGSQLLSKEDRERGAKDPALQLLYRQVKDLQRFQDRTQPEHSRLLQQDMINRRIFEQLNNQQKHINEIISSQDKILREQMLKIDLIERQEECIIDKIDEFMRETIHETAREIHNETEYHHYRHRKLQQTLLQQAAERTAGLLDTSHLESQVNDLRGMFAQAQEERQNMMAALTAANTAAQASHGQAKVLEGPGEGGKGPLDDEPGNSNGDIPAHHHQQQQQQQHQKQQQEQQQQPPPQAQKQQPLRRVEGRQQGAGGRSSTFPYPSVKGGHEPPANPPPRTRAVDIVSGLPTPFSATASTALRTAVVPPALRKKRQQQKKEEEEEEEGGGGVQRESWWSGLRDSASALRPSPAFEQQQEEAEASLKRVEANVFQGTAPPAQERANVGSHHSSVVSFADLDRPRSSTSASHPMQDDDDLDATGTLDSFV